jgi:hypothetical protein
VGLGVKFYPKPKGSSPPVFGQYCHSFSDVSSAEHLFEESPCQEETKESGNSEAHYQPNRNIIRHCTEKTQYDLGTRVSVFKRNRPANFTGNSGGVGNRVDLGFNTGIRRWQSRR